MKMHRKILVGKITLNYRSAVELTVFIINNTTAKPHRTICGSSCTLCSSEELYDHRTSGVLVFLTCPVVATLSLATTACHLVISHLPPQLFSVQSLAPHYK